MIIAVYFVIAGNLFACHLQLNRWALWLSMNFIGGLCSWMILLVCFPSLLMNGMILFLVGAFVGIFAVVWALMGMVFFVRKV